MNNRTRKEIERLMLELFELQVDVKDLGNTGLEAEELIPMLEQRQQELEALQRQVQVLADAEQTRYDALSEVKQCTDEGDALQEAAGFLREASALNDGQILALVTSLQAGRPVDWNFDLTPYTDALDRARDF